MTGGELKCAGPIDPNAPAGQAPQAAIRARHPQRWRTHKRAYYAIKATEDEIALPAFQRLGFLTQAKLIERAQAGDLMAKQEVWLRNARLAYSVANKFRAPPDHMADVVQSGVLGIAKAIDNFNVSLLIDFSTYAWRCVFTTIQRFGRETIFSIKIPFHQRANYHRFRKLFSNVITPNDWFDARDALLDELGETYYMLLRIHGLAVPDRIELAGDLEAPPTDNLAEQIDAESHLALMAEIEKLSHRDRTIIVHRYGLFDSPLKTLEELGQIFNLTKERVRQIQEKIEHSLRKAMYHRGFLDHLPNPAKPDTPASPQS